MNNLSENRKISDNIVKGFGIDVNEDTLEKSGEGSKGGKVIGHTKSGKPVYESKHADHYTDFSRQDHADAKNLHKEKAQRHAKAADKSRDSKSQEKRGSAKKHSEYYDNHMKMATYHELNADPGR